MKSKRFFSLVIIPILTLIVTAGGSSYALATSAFALAEVSSGYLPLIMSGNAQSSGQAIAIDHTTTDLSKVLAYYINQAKPQLSLSYGHTSDGSQPISGMSYLKEYVNASHDFNTHGDIQTGVLSISDYTPSGDLGNPDYQTWESRTRTYLEGSGGNRNVVVWSWCGQVSGATETAIDAYYLSLMAGLERDYPEVTFVYMTGHLDGLGENGNLYQRNNQIRNYVNQNDKVLFDFADIERYDPDGNYYPDANDRSR